MGCEDYGVGGRTASAEEGSEEGRIRVAEVGRAVLNGADRLRSRSLQKTETARENFGENPHPKNARVRHPGQVNRNGREDGLERARAADYSERCVGYQYVADSGDDAGGGDFPGARWGAKTLGGNGGGSS